MARKTKVINALLYQLGWCCCMFWPDSPLGALSVLVMLIFHFKFCNQPEREIFFLLTASILGYSMDKTFDYYEILETELSSNGSFYLFYLWILFSTTLRSSMNFCLQKLKWALLLGALAPIAYLGGQKIGRVEYLAPQSLSLCYHSLGWCAIMSLVYLLNKKIFSHHE